MQAFEFEIDAKKNLIEIPLIRKNKVMQISIVDLTYIDILKALERNENITVLHHGKVKGIIKPIRKKQNIREHPFFGLCKEQDIPVLEELENLRKPRYDL